MAFTTSASVFPLNDLGRQRRQARYPARSASSGRAKKCTFSRRGRRAAHDGRQYTPVLETANTNSPSRAASRAITELQRGSLLGPRLRASAISAERVEGLSWRWDIAFRLSAVSMALLVMARKAYGECVGADYPILAGKVKF